MRESPDDQTIKSNWEERAGFLFCFALFVSNALSSSYILHALGWE